ncbi:hypothetical protein, partial [Erwinia amylovora]
MASGDSVKPAVDLADELIVDRLARLMRQVKAWRATLRRQARFQPVLQQRKAKGISAVFAARYLLSGGVVEYPSFIIILFGVSEMASISSLQKTNFTKLIYEFT